MPSEFRVVYPADPLLGDIAHIAERGTTRFFPDVEPLLVPFGQRSVPWAAEIPVLHPIAQIEVYSTCNLRASNCPLLPPTKKITKKVEVRLYSNIGLAQINEGGDEKNRVWVQVADPNLIVKKKALEERVDRNPKAPLEKIFKNYNLTGTGVGLAFPFRRPPAAELLVVK